VLDGTLYTPTGCTTIEWTVFPPVFVIVTVTIGIGQYGGGVDGKFAVDGLTARTADLGAAVVGGAVGGAVGGGVGGGTYRAVVGGAVTGTVVVATVIVVVTTVLRVVVVATVGRVVVAGTVVAATTRRES
jgi:hypothetical protein